MLGLLFSPIGMLICGIVIGAVVAYFVLKNNRRFLNASLASLAQGALDAASKPTVK